MRDSSRICLLCVLFSLSFLSTNESNNETKNQHKHFNTLLNSLKTASSAPDSSSNQLSSSPIGYTHLYLLDSFYSPPEGTDRDKIRVTRDEKTGTVLECMRKIRLGDLNVYSPKREADWRVSVNLEVPGAFWPLPFPFSLLELQNTKKRYFLFSLVPHPIGSPTRTRRKDRMSYSHEEFKIDLTQVTSSMSPNAPVNNKFPLLIFFLIHPRSHLISPSPFE